MKYIVTYSETLARTYIVEADNESEARCKVYDAVEDGDIELTIEDYLCDSGEATIDEPYFDGAENYFDEL